MQLWSERGELLLQLGDLAPGVVTTTVTLSMDGRYIIRSASHMQHIIVSLTAALPLSLETTPP